MMYQENTIYIIDEKAQNRYSALFQIKDVLSKHLTTLKGINEVLSNCFDRPIEYVKEFLLSKGIEKIEEPPFEFKDITTSSSLITTKDTLTSQQISETPTEINTTTLPSESDKYITEIEEKSYTTHSTEEGSEHIIDQAPEITSQIEVRVDPMLAEKARSSEKEDYLIQEDSYDQKPIEIIKLSEQKSNLIELIDKDARTSSTFQKAEEKSHEKWKPKCNPDEIDVRQILPKCIEPSGKKALNDQARIIFPSTTPERDHTIDKQIETLSEEDRRAIGRWGEEFVFHYLKEKYRREYGNRDVEIEESEGKVVLKHNDQILVEIYWLNYKRDVMKEYDIKIVESGKEKYIEVKSTIGDSKSWFEISLNQLIFAIKHSSNYYIYRVYKAGTKEPKLAIFKDPYRLWQERKLEVHVNSMRIYNICLITNCESFETIY